MGQLADETRHSENDPELGRTGNIAESHVSRMFYSLEQHVDK